MKKSKLNRIAITIMKLVVVINVLILLLLIYEWANCSDIFHDQFESPISETYILSYDTLTFMRDVWLEQIYTSMLCVILYTICSLFFLYTREKEDHQ